jgi:hypothetical protein
MRGAVGLYRPTHEQQADHNTENQLFLPGQAVHARQYSAQPLGSQWELWGMSHAVVHGWYLQLPLLSWLH